jgi:hypothetical protein
MRPLREIDPNDCRITGIVLVQGGRVSNGGNRFIANFDCNVRGILIKGCALVRTEKNGIAVWTPRMHSDKDDPRQARQSVTIIDDALRHTILDVARNAYRALGGTEAEWTPRDAD